jgi:deoxyribodipyrimidine photolyase
MPGKSALPCIVWFRDDLRLSDHPALHAASKTGPPATCLPSRPARRMGVRRLAKLPRRSPGGLPPISVTKTPPGLRVFTPFWRRGQALGDPPKPLPAPDRQGEKFDPDGVYVRRWMPELAALPTSLVHRPWSAAPLELRGAGVDLGKTYPAPIIDHRVGRERTLKAYAKVRAE